jgi:hypothetical protein
MIFKPGYLCSFYHAGKVEMAAGVDARSVDIGLPLPVVNISIVYHVTCKFKWQYRQKFYRHPL